jgi:ribonuclease HI/transposase InsO family protein
LEAVVVALKQAHERQMKNLILLSDSAYAINCINLFDNDWQFTSTEDSTQQILIDATGKEPKNSDLFIEIHNVLQSTKGPRTFFDHVRRYNNTEADALASQAFQLLFPTKNRLVYAVQTRAQKRARETARDLPLWTSEQQGKELMGEYADDDIVIWIDVDDEDDEVIERWNQIDTYAMDDDELNDDMAALTNPLEERDPLEIQLNQIPYITPEEVDDEGNMDEETPTFSNQGPPEWTRDFFFPHDRKKMAHIPILRIEAPQMQQLMQILTLLPAAQKKDEELNEIINQLNFPGRDPLTRKLDRTLHQYSIQRKTDTLTITLKDGRVRFMVPTTLQIPIMEIFHKSPAMGGHPKVKPTYMHIQRYFYWKEMLKHIQSYCDNCAACLAGRNPSMKIPGFMTLPEFVEGPFQVVHADTMKSLSNSAGYYHALVVVCKYTKYVFTHPLRSMHPRQIIEGLSQIFTRFGQPALFIADNGTEFRNLEVISFLEMWGVNWRFSAPYNPQANGQAEAGVKIISTKIRLTLTELTLNDSSKFAPNKWSILLPYVTWAYNSCPNEMTGFSPYELVFGRMPILPMKIPDDVLDPSDWKGEKAKAPYDYLQEVKKSLEEAYEIVNAKAYQRRLRMKDHYDKSRSELLLEVGDYVYITWPFSKKLKKFEPRCYGPYPVIEISRHPETNDIVSVVCNLATAGATEVLPKRFPRRRIRPIRATLPKTNWQQLERLISPINDEDADSTASPNDVDMIVSHDTDALTNYQHELHHDDDQLILPICSEVSDLLDYDLVFEIVNTLLCSE